MNQITKIILVTAVFVFSAFTIVSNTSALSFDLESLGATIFSGSVESDDPGSVGYCLRYPDAADCVDADYGTVCNNPAYQNDAICMSEAEIGAGLAETSLLGSGITHTQNAGDLIIKYVNFVLPYLTLAAFVGFVVAGFFYVTAYGNQEQLDKAKKILIWSIVGLVLVISAFTIVQFLTQDLLGGLQSGVGVVEPITQ
ncbi:pilin [Patescibacteria group bacterium]|nr:pilin [Patescibacteria group bacterium]